MRVSGLLMAGVLMAGCTQETQNQLARKVENWTGVNGVLEVYGADRVVRRFIGIDKLSTAYATGSFGEVPRYYRFGYGVLDENMNMQRDADEVKVYFEVGPGTKHVFFESPR